MTHKLTSLFCGLLTLAMTVFAQAPSLTPGLFTGSYVAGGASYLANGSPRAAATGLIAKPLTDGSGTQAFFVFDALPQSLSPFTVNYNVAAGIAQKLATIRGIDLYAPTAAGLSWSGTNQGWQWTTGALLRIPTKHFDILPNVRTVRSSINANSGNQWIIGVMFGTKL